MKRYYIDGYFDKIPHGIRKKILSDIQEELPISYLSLYRLRKGITSIRLEQAKKIVEIINRNGISATIEDIATLSSGKDHTVV